MRGPADGSLGSVTVGVRQAPVLEMVHDERGQVAELVVGVLDSSACILALDVLALLCGGVGQPLGEELPDQVLRGADPFAGGVDVAGLGGKTCLIVLTRDRESESDQEENVSEITCHASSHLGVKWNPVARQNDPVQRGFFCTTDMRVRQYDYYIVIGTVPF